MKIAMLISRFPPHVGGTEWQAFWLSKELVALGVHVEVLTQRHRKNLSSRETLDGVEVIRLGHPGNSLWASGRYFLESLRYLYRERPLPDIFHAHMIASPAVVACLARNKFHKKSLVKVACSGTYGDVATSKATWYGEKKLTYVLEHMDRVVCVSGDIEEEISKQGVSSSKLARIPNGVDTTRYRPAADEMERKDTQQRLELPAGTWVMFSGRLTPQKRPMTLLEAFAQVAVHHPEARLLFIGDGEEKSKLLHAVAEKKLTDRVFIRPPQENIDAYYRACDVFVLASQAEGLSNSLLEAMSSGLVCVASRIGGTVDVLVDGKNGFLFSPSEVALLAEVLSRALGPTGSLDALRQEARKTVVEKFNLSSVAQRYLNLYSQLLNTNS